MSRSYTPSQPHESYEIRKTVRPDLARSRAAALHTHPDDVANDPKLTTPQKRALLASWISDARAVENAPALRRLDSGAIVDVASIRRALSSLDEVAPERKPDRTAAPPSRRRGGVLSTWLSRVGRTSASNDNDDDPPPAPAGFGLPFNPDFVAAHGAFPERQPGLACAA